MGKKKNKKGQLPMFPLPPPTMITVELAYVEALESAAEALLELHDGCGRLSDVAKQATASFGLLDKYKRWTNPDSEGEEDEDD